MICSYCGKSSNSSVCDRCRAEMNNILNYNDRFIHFNDMYALFGALNALIFIIAFISVVYFLFSFDTATVNSAITMSSITVISSTLFIVFTGIRDKYENKISDFIENEMRERHGRW